MKKRIIAGLSVAALWLCALYYMPGWFLFAALLGVFYLCHREFYQMLTRSGHELGNGMGIAIGAIWLTVTYLFPYRYLRAHFDAGMPVGSLLAVLTFFGLMIRVLFDDKLKRPLEYAALTLLSFFYLPFMLSFFIRVAQWQSETLCGMSEPRQGIFMIFFIALAVKMGDVGGYGFGMAFGKHKMIPRVSPNKSWEGLVGGYATSIACSVGAILVAGRWSLGGPLSTLSWTDGIALGALLNTVGVLGDLIESLFKRIAAIKDSAGLLPGLGGFLDMFDSLIFAPAVFYFYMVFVAGATEW